MIERKYIETQNGRISYLNGGDGNKGVIYLTGAYGGQDTFQGLVDHFSDWNVVSPDLPGHGESFSLKSDFDYRMLVVTMREFANEVFWDRSCVLVAHSLGARVGIDLSMGDSPIEAMVLMAPPLVGLNKGLVGTALAASGDYLNDVGRGARKAASGGLVVNLMHLKNVRAIWKIVSRLETIRVLALTKPTLMMWGKDDSVVPFSRNKEIAIVSGAAVEMFDGGHYWFLKSGSLVWERVEAWLASLGGTG